MDSENIRKVENGVIVDVDNYTSEHLNDPMFVEHIINFSERGGASAFLSKSIKNLNILKNKTSLPIFADTEENFNNILIPKTYENFVNIIKLRPEFIIIDISSFENNYESLSMLIKKIRFSFDGGLVGRISNKGQALEAYRLGIELFIIEVFGEYIDHRLIQDICCDINIPTIVSLNSVSFEQSKELFGYGVHSFILGEDVTNPNRIIKQFTI